MEIMCCFVDGGYNNSHCDKGYGSYAIRYRGKIIERSNIFELPVRTPNEAEYYSLLLLLDSITKRGDKENFMWVINSDSQLMVGQINGTKRCLAHNLLPLYRMAKAFTVNMENIMFVWRPRKKIKKVLGH